MKPCPIDNRWHPHAHSSEELADFVEKHLEFSDNLARQLSAANDELEIAVDALTEIENWTKAYPLEVFPEPDFERARQLLEAGGITLDAVSASNMRHVINGVKGIVDTAMKKLTDEEVKP